VPNQCPSRKGVGPVKADVSEGKKSKDFRGAWNERLRALRNIPPVLHIVWEAGPSVVLWGILLRLAAGFIPLSTLAVTRWIIDAIVAHISKNASLSGMFWWMVGLEFALASLGAFLARIITYCDSLLADKYIRHISVRVMEHASRVDMTRYDDPAFYDQLERARVQATDRLMMIQAGGNLLQQAITTATLAASILFFSPWLLLLLVLFVIPAFLGDSHFAFLGYALNFRLTPVRRELDYLRTLGASKESAKELKLFGLSSYLTGRYKTLSDEVYRENVALAGRKLRVGAVLSVLTTAGYYSGYAYVIYQTLIGAIHVGTLVFLTGAIAGCSNNIQQMFSTFAGIADQALFLTDLLAFFAVRPGIQSPPDAIPAPRVFKTGFEFQNV
jgi:ATP-binding cassette, subfamily B, bacterial